MLPPSQPQWRIFTAAFLTYTIITVLSAPFSAARVAHQPSTLGSLRSDSKEPAQRADEILVKFRADSSRHDRDKVIAKHGVRLKKKLKGESGIEKLQLLAGRTAKDVLFELLTDPQVEFAEPNYLIEKDQIVPADPQFSDQWALRNTGQSGGQPGADINVGEAWKITTGSPSLVVAVIDSGIDFSHADLTDNQWANSAPGPDGDVHGWDYIAENGTIRDGHGHGTAIAGIIAAESNNNIGISGVMWRASLMSLRVLDDTGTGDIASAVEAIDYAAGHGAQVNNLSWGTRASSWILKDAIDRAIRRGAMVVCSAGNGGQDLNKLAYYPASYKIRGLVSVAATDQFDRLASWSNWGSAEVTIAAPGTNILTTKNGGGYWTVSGTSAAAPLVTGIVGLIRTIRPHKTFRR